MSETEPVEGRRDYSTPREQSFVRGIEMIFYAVALIFFVYLFRYYMTGAGGPSLLAVTGVPLAFCVVVLNDLRNGEFYPRLDIAVSCLIAAVYIAISMYVAFYMVSEFDAIRIYRIGVWNDHDLIVGGAMAALILEYTRRRYFPVFVVNIALILYTAYGYLVPGIFNHPGMPWRRVVSSMSVEMSTGVFEQLAQLGLTLIGSFILVLAALRAFGCIDSILKASSRLAARSPQFLPQAAVIGSIGVGAVSGSGAANAATTGSATIPVLIRAGFPRVTAAAVETASSLGGQLMPPLMGIAAFLMAEYLRVSYFEVVARGFAPAIIYFLGVSFAVFLLATRYHRRAVVPEVEPLGFMDVANIIAYAIAVGGLIFMMGFQRQAAMTSAQTVFMVLVAFLGAAFIIRSVANGVTSLREWFRPVLRLIDGFATVAAELTILLATLGILTATFTITGVPTKVGVLLMEGAGVNIALMAIIAFGFGYLVGMGLPVSPTYIVTAVVVAPFMIKAGLDPWAVHFFAFFVAVFGELSPPTSVTAAVASRIADAPFVRTMMFAMLMCMPLIVMMFAMFTRPELVVEPGLAQLPAFTLVLIGTLAISFVIQGRFFEAAPPDIGLRAVLAIAAALTLLHPGREIAAVAALAATVLVAFGVLAMRKTQAAPLAQGGEGTNRA